MAHAEKSDTDLAGGAAAEIPAPVTGDDGKPLGIDPQGGTTAFGGALDIDDADAVQVEGEDDGDDDLDETHQ